MKMFWPIIILLSLHSCKQVNESNTEATSDVAARSAAALRGAIKKSKKLKNLEDEFLGIRTKNDVHRLIERLFSKHARSDSLKKEPTDYAFVVAQLLPLREYRSIVYKMVPLLDKTNSQSRYEIDTPGADNMAVMLMQQASAGLNLGSGRRQWRAVYEYMAEPFEDNAHAVFGKAEDFQSHICQRAMLSHEVAIVQLMTMKIGKPLKYDNGIIFDTTNFASNEDRYVLIGNPEKSALLSAAHYAMHATRTFCAYNVRNLTYFAETWGEIIGFDAFRGDRAPGSSALRRAFIAHGGSDQGSKLEEYYTDRRQLRRDRRIIKKFGRHTRETLTLREDRMTSYESERMSIGRANMRKALNHLRASVKYADRAWKAVKKRGPNVYYPLTRERFLPWRRVNDKSLARIKRLVGKQQPTVIKSDIDGTLSAQINLPAFYRNPPADLRSLLPTSFDKRDKAKIRAEKNGKKYEYRHYSSGQAKSWNAGVYRHYMPGVTETGVSKTARVLNETWGGAGTGLPLTAFVF